MCYPFPQSLVNYGDYLRQRRLELGWTQNRTATLLGVSEDTLRGWELGKMEPKARRIPHIVEFLGKNPLIERYEVAALIRQLRKDADCSYEDLGGRIGICGDTLVNLKNGRYQPTRRTYQLLTAYAETLNT